MFCKARFKNRGGENKETQRDLLGLAHHPSCLSIQRIESQYHVAANARRPPSATAAPSAIRSGAPRIITITGIVATKTRTAPTEAATRYDTACSLVCNIKSPSRTQIGFLIVRYTCSS